MVNKVMSWEYLQNKGVTCFLCVCSVAQSCLSLWDPMHWSPPGSSVHGIFQARILGWVAISYSKGSSRPRNRTPVSCGSCIGRRILYHWATWEALSQFYNLPVCSSYIKAEKDIVTSFLSFFYWSMGDLQPCLSFWCITKWFRHFPYSFPFLFIFFSITAYYRILNIVPCAIQ